MNDRIRELAEQAEIKFQSTPATLLKENTTLRSLLQQI
jgi:hypothetical protein